MDSSKQSISFKALHLANEQRTAYGLRYNDFTRYRKHCANRTHRLRSTLKLTHGKGRDFKKLPPLSADVVKEGHLQLLLLEAERAWAYAQELIGLSILPAYASNASTLRHSATGRFRRAIHWSTQLLSLCQALYSSSRFSAEDLLQITVYTIIMNGRFLRFRDDFEDALLQLCVARGILDELSMAATTSRDKALAVLFSDEISPEIRYCAHELGRERSYDVDAIVSELFHSHKDEILVNCDAVLDKLRLEKKSSKKGQIVQKLKDLTWDGQSVPVRNPELVDVLLKVQEAEKKLEVRDATGEIDQKIAGNRGHQSKKGVAAYDGILLALSDAEEVSRKMAEAQQLTGTGSASMSTGGRDIHFLHAYILHQLISRRIQRDLLLVSTLLADQAAVKPRFGKSKPEGAVTHELVDSRLYPAVVKLLDTVLQGLMQMRTLSIVDDNPDLSSGVEARISFTKAKRCLYLGRCYAALKKFAEALTLLQHANIHIRETFSALSLSDSGSTSDSGRSLFELSDSSIKELENYLVMDALQFKRDWFAYNGGSVDANPKIYKKPLFFNIALNYVELDMDRLLELAGKQPNRFLAAAPSVGKVEATSEKKQTAKAKVEEARSATPEPQISTRGGLSSLLGGWWGRS